MFMANGHGGARAGAGRKSKPLIDKIMEDTTKKHKPKILDIPDGELISAEPPEYLGDFATLDTEPTLEDIYTNTVKWLQKTGCLHLVNPDFIMEYAVLKSRWQEHEFIAGQKIAVVKANGEVAPNPFYQSALEYLREANAVWDKIWRIVAQNCVTEFGGGNPHADVMEILIRGCDDAV